MFIINNHLNYKSFKVFINFILFLSIFCVKANSEKEKLNNNQENIYISAKSAIVICADSCDIIWQKSPHMPLPMASTTKIMTSILGLEKIAANGNKKIEINEEIINVEGSSMGLEVGDVVTLEQLVYGMLLPSGNDAANATAVCVSKNVDEFLKLMNERAIQIGMKNTFFETPSGLSFGKHHSTAYDMSILASYAMENKKFSGIVKKWNETIILEDGKKIYLKNHNKLLKLYPYCIGIKTGFTKASGRCLVSCSERNGIKIIVVTLNASSDWEDHIVLYDYAFKNVISKIFDDSNFIKTIKINKGQKEEINVSSFSKFSKIFKSDIKDSEITREIELPDSVYAPIKKGQILGKIIYKHENILLGENLITANSDVLKKELNFFQKILEFFKKILEFFKKILEFFKKIFLF